jgi:hypothetical protein
LWIKKIFVSLHSGSESVNPAKFSEAEQSLVKQRFSNKLKFKIMNEILLSQAIEAYFEVCHQGIPVTDRKGNVYSMLVYQQPSQSDSIIGRKYVYLRNCNGELARYNIKTGEITV